MKWYQVFFALVLILIIIAIFFGQDVKPNENLDREVMEMMYPEEKKKRKKIDTKKELTNNQKEAKDLVKRLIQLHLQRKQLEEKSKEQNSSTEQSVQQTDQSCSESEQKSETKQISPLISSASIPPQPVQSQNTLRDLILSQPSGDLVTVLTRQALPIPAYLLENQHEQIQQDYGMIMFGQQERGLSPPLEALPPPSHYLQNLSNNQTSPRNVSPVAIQSPLSSQRYSSPQRSPSPIEVPSHITLISETGKSRKKKIVNQGAINLSCMTVPDRRGLVREPKCGEILQRIFGREFLQGQRPDFLRNPETGRNLELDWWCPELRLALEHNGEQHYKFPNGFHNTKPKEYLDHHQNNPTYYKILKDLYDNDKEAFKQRMKQDDPKDEIGLRKFAQQLRRDEFKKSVCEEEGICLISVPYHVPFEDLEQFIIDSIPERLRPHMLPYY